MTSPRVAVFGSLHYDIMVDAPALPRLGETVAGTGWRPKFGGKGGNQAAAAVRAGASADMIGAVGDDAFGRTLLAELDQAGVGRSHVRVKEEAGSGMSVAITEAGGDYGAVIASGANLLLGAPDVERAAALIGTAGILVLQNEVPESANLAAARVARKAGVPVLLNAAPARPLSPALRGALDILVVNAGEAEAMGSQAVGSLAEAQAAAEFLARRVPTAVVTAGGHGVAAAQAGTQMLALPARRVTVRSTHGAGDTFIGWLAAGLAGGASLAQALEAANEAAAKLVSGET